MLEPPTPRVRQLLSTDNTVPYECWSGTDGPSVVSRPLLHGFATPDASCCEDHFGLREVLVSAHDRVHPLPGDPEHVSDLSYAHEVVHPPTLSSCAAVEPP